MPEREAQAPQDEDNRLYCICLGTDDKTPMIQCEGCDNWYHFRCLELTEEEAKSIQVFYCEMCEEADIGHTQSTSPLPSPLSPSFPPTSATRNTNKPLPATATATVRDPSRADSEEARMWQ
ncbi:uncharacterized protein L969DRAFT_551017 [Mixia osmundae IAM 14324]|uniref:uncharacterized protein n=1 Tax=Mixia osmundae (strain CBS 9802 / IAM 14324 / JCM 22182 / KY 12970) TaxID=764103 RepID=UPI0004A55556|nr:uncharacterized protein L969DRAFT_551017 [Mixia osmundae IAM 14324]KEI37849.1 hypothetical protein L969DRAFT_551017 [Mixia osmundae IAM 14324]